MKVTDVKTLPYDAAFRDVVLAKVETDEGIHGWGAAAAMFPRTICATPLPGCTIGARPGAPRP